MFTFMDIPKLDDRSTQKMLREIEMDELATALKDSPEKVREKILRNMSKDAREQLVHDIAELGDVEQESIERWQDYIVGIIRTLEKKGEITIPD